MEGFILMITDEKLIQKAVDLWGTTEDCYDGTFILPNGEILSGMKDGRRTMHFDVTRSLYPEGTFNTGGKFIREANAVRYFPRSNTLFVEFSDENGLTKKQLETIEYCSCFHNIDANKRIWYDVIDHDGEGYVESDAVYQDELGLPSCFSLVKQLGKKFGK